MKVSEMKKTNKNIKKFIAYYLPEWGVEQVIKGNTIEKLQEIIEFWYSLSTQMSGVKSVVSEGAITIGDREYVIYEVV
jgi:hypothetical protein